MKRNLHSMRDHLDHGGHSHAHTHDPAPQQNLDPAQESLASALQSGFNVLRLLMLALVVLYFASGWFQVNPGEQGVIVRFGELRENDTAGEFQGTAVFGEGTYLTFPEPIDKSIKVDTRNQTLVVTTFAPPIDASAARSVETFANLDLSEHVRAKRQLQPGVDGAMITGDRALSHGVWAVEYRITNAADFVRHVGEDDGAIRRLLRRLLENSVVRAVAGMPVERIVRTQTDEIQGDFTRRVQTLLEQELAALETGVTIVNVEAKTIEPGAVRQAFLDVTNARSDRRKNLDEARQERNRILSNTAGSEAQYEALLAAIDAYDLGQSAGASAGELTQLRDRIDELLADADGEVAVRLRQARAMATQQRERVRNEYAEFLAYRATWTEFPELTVRRLWNQAREQIFENEQLEVLFIPTTNIIEIITGRDVFRALQAEQRRYLRENPIQ